MTKLSQHHSFIQNYIVSVPLIYFLTFLLFCPLQTADSMVLFALHVAFVHLFSCSFACG